MLKAVQYLDLAECPLTVRLMLKGTDLLNGHFSFSFIVESGTVCKY